VTIGKLGQVKLFRVSRSVRPFLKSDFWLITPLEIESGKVLPLSAVCCLDALEQYINGALIEERRIEVSNEANGRLEPLKLKDPTVFNKPDVLRTIADQRWATVDLIFLDIHFYCVCIDKAAKLGDTLLAAVNTLPVPSLSSDKTTLRVLRQKAEHALSNAASQVIAAPNCL